MLIKDAASVWRPARATPGTGPGVSWWGAGGGAGTPVKPAERVAARVVSSETRSVLREAPRGGCAGTMIAPDVRSRAPRFGSGARARLASHSHPRRDARPILLIKDAARVWRPARAAPGTGPGVSWWGAGGGAATPVKPA